MLAHSSRSQRSKLNSQKTQNIRTQSNSTQRTLEESFAISQSIENNKLKEFVKKCVRYFVYRAGSHVPIRKVDLQKNVLHGCGKLYNKIITETTHVLQQVYGLDVVAHEYSATTKLYIICNHLPYKEFLLHEDLELNLDGHDYPIKLPKDVQKILILLVLTHIFMSGESVPEASLISFLELMDIDYESTHKLFGNVKDFVTNVMVKQKYLNLEVDETTRKVSFSWGPRANCEISKNEILGFVCKIFKDRTPNSWISQFQDASSQNPVCRLNSTKPAEREDLNSD